MGSAKKTRARAACASMDPARARKRPKLATTVAAETLAALATLSSGPGKRGNVGAVVDRLVWTAVCHRLDALATRYELKAHDPGRWHELPLYLGTPFSPPDADRILLGLVLEHAATFGKLSEEDRKQRRTELRSAHEARIASGLWSSLDDFVALFVASLVCPCV